MGTLKGLLSDQCAMSNKQAQPDTLPLTPRQLEIFGLMAKGLSNKEICNLLGISNNTVKIHVAAILRNLDVANRTEAVFAYKEMLQGEAPSPGEKSQLLVSDRIGRPAIAVLPFAEGSGSREDAQLSEGVVEELLDHLSSWQWFPVIAYGSSRRFDEPDIDLRSVGEQLGAAYLIGGSLRRNKERVKVSIRLTQTQTGQRIWSRTFDLSTEDLFELQAEIARQVVQVLAPELIDAEASKSRNKPKTAFSTWELICQGMWHLNRGGKQDTDLAYTLFTDAIEQDAEFGLAWVGRVGVHQKRLYEQTAENPRESVAELVQDAQTCLRLEPRVAHSHACVGLAHILLGQQDSAILHLEQALQLNPSSSRALILLAQAYGMVGRLDECILHAEELVRIDPISASSYRHRAILGVCYFAKDEYDESLRWANSAVASRPDMPNTYLPLIAAHVGLGNQTEAEQALAQLHAHCPEFVLSRHIDMMRPFTRADLLEKFTDALAKVGLTA